jgi:hypothetical protein
VEPVEGGDTFGANDPLLISLTLVYYHTSRRGQVFLLEIN